MGEERRGEERREAVVVVIIVTIIIIIILIILIIIIPTPPTPPPPPLAPTPTYSVAPVHSIWKDFPVSAMCTIIVPHSLRRLRALFLHADGGASPLAELFVRRSRHLCREQQGKKKKKENKAAEY